MNDDQKKFMADCLKLVAVGQLGIIGFKALQDNDHGGFLWSLAVGILLVTIAIYILGTLKSE